MVYVGILAAGLGVRMHRQDLPKQFLQLGEKPIIVHTLEQFFTNPNVGRIIVVAHDDWTTYTEDLLSRYNFPDKECYVISGGRNKTESMYAAVRFIGGKWGFADEDMIVAHDAIRPFVTQRIIDDNIAMVRKYGAANTSISTNDAVLESRDGVTLDSVPVHEHLFAEQTPQSYALTKLNVALELALGNGVNLSEENELPRIYMKAGNPMRLVRGEYFNVKIINPYDLEVAEALLKERFR